MLKLTSTSPTFPSSTVTYATPPRTIPSSRKKYRDSPAFTPKGPLAAASAQSKRAQIAQRIRERQTTPGPVEGRQNIEVQTELYLEEITDRVKEAEVETQTDPLLDVPEPPRFVPQKYGVDEETQIEPGELFDFDYEVQPILEVLVGKVLEQSLLEVMQEEELENIRLQKQEFERIRAARLAEVQRLEEQERRKQEEVKRRIAQEQARVERERRTREKVAARAFAQKYLEELTPSVFDTLTNSGYFFDPVQREVETVFMPWLYDESQRQIRKEQLAKRLLEDLVRNALNRSKDLHRAEKKRQQQEEERLRAEAEAERVAQEAAAKKAEDEGKEGGQRGDEGAGDEEEGTETATEEETDQD